METFIDQVIGEIRHKFGNDLRSVCVVFPTRRACLIFRHRLAASLEKPIWSPGIMSIGDFVSKHANNPVSDEIPLLLALYEIYKKEWPNEDFSKFYSWGKMLLNDFDEIDKQLSDPTKIFLTISELKKIDASFLPEPESLKWIREFIATIDEERLSGIKKQFSNTWDRLKDIYSDYNKLLDKKGLAYEGKAYREIVSKFKNKEFRSNWQHFVFAGFYGFSRIEERLITELNQLYKVDVFWDADSYYINNKNHEAGYYFRKSTLCEGNFNWNASHFTSGSKKIEITGIPLQAGQAKYAGELLIELQQQGKVESNHTAIIIPDENMLFPVLFSLPGSVDSVNVTMGYPLEQSQYQELIRILWELHHHSRTSGTGKQIFHQRLVQRLFTHPLLKNKIERIESDDRTSTGYQLDAATISEFYNFEASKIFFKKINSSHEVFSYLDEVLIYLKEKIIEDAGSHPHFEDKVIDYILHELKILRDQIKDYFNEITPETAWQMAKECISGLKVPFSGEPVQGLQVMGFLETRALDFKTIIILSCNEGILPASSVSKSFIPFSIRKGFGLSTYEDQDASWSYHFYRLLHKAENIYLLYNSEVSKTNGGEPTRYFLQLQQELKSTMGERLSIINKNITTPILVSPETKISINKDETILEILKAYVSEDSGISKRNFSSSAITTYINCSLQFYYRYVAGLKEVEMEEDGMEDRTFGSILHKTFEKLYSDYSDIIDDKIVDTLLSKSDNVVNGAVAEIYKMNVSHLQGSDILLAEVIRELTRRILEADKKDTPFRITGLEKQFTGKYNTGRHSVGIYGNIDRLDEKGGISRIIDYKTGKIDLSLKELKSIFEKPGKKATFQLYFYALLFHLNYPETPVKTGFYHARELVNGITWLNKGEVISEFQLNEFSNHLSELINEILNPEIAFRQTDDLLRCKICPYNMICNR